MAEFFIKRPVFAWVIAIGIMLCGALCLYGLPIAQYPSIALPRIYIWGQYPGANARIVDQSVTQIVEQQMTGLDGLLYMDSSSDSFGNIEMHFTFTADTDPDIAQVQVQNKLSRAMTMLPEEVQRNGIEVGKSARNSFLIVAFYSPDNSLSASDVSDYVASNLREPISRVQGVGQVSLWGGQNAMRIWLDPEKMRKYSINPQDVTSAVAAQNAQVPGGQSGAAPAVPGQQTTYTINAASRLGDVSEFEDIVLRAQDDGGLLLLKDVARVELNSESFMGQTWFNGHNGVGLALRLAAGANVMEVTKAAKKEIESLARFFPPGIAFAYADDREPIIAKSMSSVKHTLFEAIALVVGVMFLFLQNWRATIIPTITIPVVLLGVFAVLASLGYSINTLTMFGLVLAIGLLVDDAIIVVENVERVMDAENVSAMEASLKSMRQITYALIGVAMVISAVFVPMAFMGGSVGVIYRQFSITIVSAMALSVLIAIILTPMMCSRLLKPGETASQGFFGSFNRLVDRAIRVYAVGVRKTLNKKAAMGLGFLAIIAVSAFLYIRIPSAFLPDEDQGIIFIDIQLPPAASFERTEAVLKKLEKYFMEEEKDTVDTILSVMGWGLTSSGQGSGMMFPKLKDWSKRGKGQSVWDLIERANRFAATIPEAQIFVMAPPSIMELGQSGGFDMQIMDRGAKGHDELMAAKNEVLEKAGEDKKLAYARFAGLEDTSQYELDIDVKKAGVLGLDKDAINGAIATWWGGNYVNDFVDRGRTKKVYAQADSRYRKTKDDFEAYYIRNRQGNMVPLNSFITVKEVMASPKLTRYQGVPSINIQGSAARGVSSGDAMREMENIAKTLPAGFDMAWTGLSYQEQETGDQAPFLYAISLIVVFLCLAALYESWAIPFAVLMAVPAGLCGALAGIWLRGMNNDIYFQIAVLTIIGLSAKNSILIVEFAKQLHDGGKSVAAATVEAARLRLRPIVMTSLCFILGVVPLAISGGVGSGAQNALGTAVIAGMIAATSLGLYFTPFFYALIAGIIEKHKKQNKSKLKAVQTGETF